MIKKGTNIYYGKPFVFVLNKKFVAERCDHCLKRTEVAKCNGCRYVHYCNRTCQTEAWKVHHSECKNIRHFSGVIKDDMRFLARIITKLTNGGNNEKDYYEKDKYRQFKDLISHKEYIKKDRLRMAEFNLLYTNLCSFMGKHSVPTYEEVMEIYGQMSLNSFTICYDSLAHIASAIYLGPSILDHSCKPNITSVNDGTTMIITTIEDLSELDWSKLRIAYTDVMDPTARRRAHLKSRYYFHCKCEKCEIPELGAACPNANCTNKCDPTNKVCSQCNQLFPPNFKQIYDEVIEFTYQYIRYDQLQNDIDLITVCLRKQEGILHFSNSLHMKCLEAALGAVRKVNNWKEVEFYLKKIIPGYLEHYGKYSFITGLFYFTLAKVYVKLKNMEKFSEMIKQSRLIFQALYGDRHKSFLEEMLKTCLPKLNIIKN